MDCLTETCNLCDEHVVDLSLVTSKHNSCTTPNNNAEGSFSFMSDYGDFCVIWVTIEQVEVCACFLDILKP